MNRRSLAVVPAIILAGMLTACGGGGTTVQTGESKTTGQELMDLQKAYESHAISEREYKKAKEKILRSR